MSLDNEACDLKLSFFCLCDEQLDFKISIVKTLWSLLFEMV